MSRPLSRNAALLAALARVARPLPRFLPAFGVVALLACMLVPLPTVAVDLLLSMSLALALLLLVACLGIRRSADFLAFPALLLFATLTRLALNVQTTRLILSDASAGEVIDAFATLVVRGEMLVGVVIFAIITAVQFLVIARGAERVAEVAARFALDGLPGQQAAIDADLRGGTISAREAGRRRAELDERSRFYGAMDGAIRFVKGDAIAGLVITAINLCGGVAIGVLRDERSWIQSLEIYGRLTIGDGLVAQIPALLVSLAAGVLVARVDRDPSSKVRALAWLDPAMMLVPATLLAGLALVPGMPRAAFGATALGLVVGGLWLAARDKGTPEAEPRRFVVSLGDPSFARSGTLRRALAELRSRCAGDLNVEVPEIVADTLEGRDPSAVELHLGARSLGLRRLSSNGDENAVVFEVYSALMSRADVLYDLDDLELALEGLRSERPAIVREALRVRRAPEILALLRGLLRERVPLPPLDVLLGAIAADRRFAEESERGRWLELARESTAGFWLRDRVISQESLGPLSWVRPTPEAEEELRERLVVGLGGHRLSLRSAELDLWRAAFVGAMGSPVVVLTTAAGRPAFAALLRGVAPFTPVFSVAEVSAAGLPQPEGDALRWQSPP